MYVNLCPMWPNKDNVVPDLDQIILYIKLWTHGKELLVHD